MDRQDSQIQETTMNESIFNFGLEINKYISVNILHIRKFYDYLQDVFINQRKTKLCQHHDSCPIHVAKAFVKSFQIGFVIRNALTFIGCLLKFKKINAKGWIFFIFEFVNWASIRFGLFLGSYSAISKATLCLLRKITKNDNGINSFLAGAIAGFASLPFQPRSSWYVIRMYLWSRAFDILINQQVEKFQIKKKSFFYCLLFGLVSIFPVYCFCFERQLLPKDLFKLYYKFSKMSINDEIWIKAAHIYKLKKLKAAGVNIKFNPDFMRKNVQF